MILSVQKSSFRVEPLDVPTFNVIAGVIGSAKIHGISDDGPINATMTKSVQNLRRLRRMFPGLAISPDSLTTTIVEVMESRHKQWMEENEHGIAAKHGANYLPFDGYNWKQKPFDHQRRIVDFLHAMKGQCGIIGDPGIGKTFAILAWIEQCIQAKELERSSTLILTKESIIDSGWMDDAKKFTGLKLFNLCSDVGAGDKRWKERKEWLDQEDVDVFIIGYTLARSDKMRKLLRSKRFSCVVLDESTRAKNHASATFRACRDFTERATKGRVIATGSPAPNGPVDLWAQMYLVDRGMTLEPSVVDFRSAYYDSIRLTGKEIRPGVPLVIYRPKSTSFEEVNKRISPRIIRFRAEDCLDLPEEMADAKRMVDMSPEQKKAYDEMRDRLYTEFSERTFSARQQGDRLMKLREITGGFMFPDRTEEDPDPDPIAIPGDNPKLIELDEMLEEITINNKAVVWCQYRWEFRTMLSRYKQYKPQALYGETPKGKVGDIVRNFQEKPECRVLFCHPQSAAWGLTLTAANYCIFYSISFDGEEQFQARKRIRRAGATKPSFYYYLLAKKSIDTTIYKALKDKKTVEDLIIDGPRNLLYAE